MGYLARLDNAKRQAERINKLIDAGYMVFDEEGERVTGRFEIDEEGVFLRISANGRAIFFLASPDHDNGACTPIHEYNEQFKKWCYVKPQHVKPIIRQRKAKQND